MAKEQPSIEIIYFDAGSGHRSAMNALKDVLAEQHPSWNVKSIDLQKLLEPVDPVFNITNLVSPWLNKLSPKQAFRPVQSLEVYNSVLQRGAVCGLSTMLPVLHHLIKANSNRIECLIQKHWQNSNNKKPNLVISVIPNFNGVLFRALNTVHPDVPFATIMTDLADWPPHFWMEKQNQHLICGTKKAITQARATGYCEPEKLHKVSGMILKRSFYEQPESSRLSHHQLGLSPDRPTALIMFGGLGSLAARTIVGQIQNAKLDVQTIVMCGSNKELYDDLQGKKGCHAVGFVSNVADYMRIADFFIGKPSPGSISEAIHMGCPVIVECNAGTLPQERPNVDWIRENDVGVVVKSFTKEIVSAARVMIRDLMRYKQNITSNIPANRAVFEIAAILDQVLTTSSVPTARGDTKLSTLPSGPMKKLG